MNTINIALSQLELCPEDRARIDTLNKALGLLIAQLEGLVAAAESKGLIETQVVEETIYEPETAPELPQDTPEEVEQPETQPEPENAQDAPTVTHEDIRNKYIALCGIGKKDAARDIIKAYADNVPDLPESALPEVLGKLTALEG
jgi:hypothetical protein